MKTIDKYILRKYVSLFFYLLTSLVLVFTIFNWIDQNDKFTSRGADLSVILRYYFYNMPYFVNIVIPICSLLAALLVYSNLSNYNEITALQAAGVSRFRAIVPSLFASLFIAFLYLVFSEYVGVPATVEKDRIQRIEIYKDRKKSDFEKRNSVFRSKGNSIVQYRYLNAQENYIKNFNIIYFDDSLNVKERVDIDSLAWRDSVWTAHSTFMRTKKNVTDTVFQLEFDSIMTEQLDFEPQDLIDRKFNPGRTERFLTIPELNEYSKNRKSFGLQTSVVDYEIWNAYFFPFSIFFMTFLGGLLGSRRAKGGPMHLFFLCILICLVYICVLVMGKVLGQANTLSPFPLIISSAFLGAILPHMLTTFALAVIAKRS